MNEIEQKFHDARKEIEAVIIKGQSDWDSDDWSKWINFLEAQTEYFIDEALRLVKENLQQKIMLEKYESFISKQLGIRNKKIKSRGLLQAPRGRPTLRNGHKHLVAQVKRWRELGLTWIEVGDKIKLFNDKNGTKHPLSERRLRELIKQAEK